MNQLVLRLIFLLAAVVPLQTAVAAPSKDGKPIPVKTYTVQAAGAAETTTAVGQLLADEAVVIRPEIAGRIAGLHFTEGGRVAAGQKLVTLDDAEYRARLSQLRAEASLATEKLRRAEELFGKGFFSEQAIIEARENRNAAQARVAEAQALLDKTVLRAPFSGVTGLRQVSPGAYLKEGQDIVTLSKTDTLKLDVRVPERFLPLIRKVKNASVSVDAWPGERFPANLYATDPNVAPDTRTVLVRARVTNRGAKLQPGMFARVEIEFSPREGIVRIPEQAVAPKSGKQMVYRVKDGKASPVAVSLGRREPGWVEVVQGLQPGDVVVTEGQIKLRPGAAVQQLNN